jgi:hypothetical protein
MTAPAASDEKRLEAGAAESESVLPSSLSPDTISPTSSRNLDDNYEIYKQYHGIDFTADEAKRVLRRVDLRLLPVLIVTYTLQYLDKNTINFAVVYGLEEGTHLTGNDYSWLGMSPQF